MFRGVKRSFRGCIGGAKAVERCNPALFTVPEWRLRNSGQYAGISGVCPQIS